MSDPSMVLRRRDELRNEIRDLQSNIKKVEKVRLISIESKDGAKITITSTFICEAVLSSLLHPCLSKMEAELKEIEDRIAKWE